MILTLIGEERGMRSLRNVICFYSNQNIIYIFNMNITKEWAENTRHHAVGGPGERSPHRWDALFHRRASLHVVPLQAGWNASIEAAWEERAARATDAFFCSPKRCYASPQRYKANTVGSYRFR